MTPRERLDSIIVEGKQNVMQTLNEVAEEFRIRKDMLVKPSSMAFKVESTGDVVVDIRKQYHSLTPYSEQQLYSKTNIPVNFAKKLISIGEGKLLEENLTVINNKINKEGLLIRSIENTIKGILSPSYKRLDASPIFEGFLEQTLKKGFVPHRGMNTYSRYNISMILPEIFEVLPNEHIVYGINITSSDYGASALNIDLSLMRIVCTNLAIGYDMLRQVHLGSKFNTEKNYIELSNETHELDVKTTISAVKDIVNNTDVHIQNLHEIVTKKATENVSVNDIIDLLKRRGVSKDVAEKIQFTFDSDLPIELPKEPNIWRMSNAISLIAHSLEGDKRLQLENEAMQILLN